MSDTMHREWRFYLDDMIGFAEKVIAYTDSLDQLLPLEEACNEKLTHFFQ